MNTRLFFKRLAGCYLNLLARQKAEAGKLVMFRSGDTATLPLQPEQKSEPSID